MRCLGTPSHHPPWPDRGPKKTIPSIQPDEADKTKPLAGTRPEVMSFFCYLVPGGAGGGLRRGTVMLGEDRSGAFAPDPYAAVDVRRCVLPTHTWAEDTMSSRTGQVGRRTKPNRIGRGVQ